MIAHAPQLAPPPSPRDSELGAPQRRPKLWAMRQHLLASGHHTALVWTLSGKSLCICLHLNSKWDGLIYFKQLVGCYVYRYKCSELLEPGNQASRNLPAVSLLRGTNNPFWGVLASSARQGISQPQQMLAPPKTFGRPEIQLVPHLPSRVQPSHNATHQIL